MKRNQIIAASVVGSALEFYDFCLFGVLSTILSQVFFPKTHPFLGIVSIFMIHATSFLVRPLGGILFGWIGDKMGRKKALSLSILLMSLPTTFIGLLPSYDSIGFLAPLLLVVFRLMQGFFVGGEHNGAAIFLMEHSKENQTGFAGALVLAGVSIGSIFALLMGSLFSKNTMPDWAWRIPFFIGSLGGLVGHFIRRRLSETPCFVEMVEKKKVLKHPLKTIFSTHKKSLLIALGVGGFSGVLGHSLSMYVGVYLAKVALIDPSVSMLYGALGLVISTPLSLFHSS